MFALLKYSGLSGFILDKKWTENLYISNKSGIGIVKIKQAFKSCFNFLRIMKLTSVFLHSSITKIIIVTPLGSLFFMYIFYTFTHTETDMRAGGFCK